MNMQKITTRSLLFYLGIIVIAYFLFHSLSSRADSEIVPIELTTDDTVLEPGNVIKLKALALKSNIKIDINQARLIAIELKAKSQQGKGRIQLRVGNKLSPWLEVPGNKKNFDNDKTESYSTIRMASPGNEQNVLWQLNINGRIKINKITLHTAVIDKQEKLAKSN